MAPLLRGIAHVRFAYTRRKKGTVLLLRGIARVHFVRGVCGTNARAYLIQQVNDQRGTCLLIVERPAKKGWPVSVTALNPSIYGVVGRTFSLGSFSFVCVTYCSDSRVEYAISSRISFTPADEPTWRELPTYLCEKQSDPGRVPCRRPAHSRCRYVQHYSKLDHFVLFFSETLGPFSFFAFLITR